MASDPASDCTARPRRWLPGMLAALLGLNLATLLSAVADRPAMAEGASCSTAQREVADLQKTLRKRDDTIRVLAGKLRQMALGNIKAVEQALSGTGIRIDELVERGRGGPFVPETGNPAADRDLARWDSLRRAMGSLPLGLPLRGEYEITSGFGSRKDPINRRSAMHEGVDFKARLRSPVAATAAGRVAFAGVKGGYGRMVEIDHGLGVKTRYAHLAAIHVKTGQAVALGQRVGLLGSSGRSTGPHLHYEVLVNEVPRNPARFFSAADKLP